MNRVRSADRAVRLGGKFVYAIVKITRFHDYQTWSTHLFEGVTRCAKVYGLLFLDCAFRVLIGKLQSHGCKVHKLNGALSGTRVCLL